MEPARDVPTKSEAQPRALHFTHPAHFTRRFRQAYGVTPKEWRVLSVRSAPPGR